MYILSVGPLMLLRSPSRLKPEEKREGEKKTQEIFCAVLFPSLSLSLSLALSLPFSLSLARHLTSRGKRQIRFRLLSRQSRLRRTLFIFFPSPSRSVFASFLWMQNCEGRLHAFQTITVHPPPPHTHTHIHTPPPPPPPPLLQVSSLPEPCTCQHILY